ncbi:hypothetical protein [Novipirellula maiorica]|uniref:hypothetical protein n=1 Tax=Novipirellula maiorica TaxID=1265734 RepID=UPI0011818507|nr:hypothetical protein [Rhodopirellula maiorica]
MIMTVKKTCQRITLCVLPIVIVASISGCGRSEHAQVVGGVQNDFLLELQVSEQQYAQQVERQDQQALRRRHLNR